MSIQYDQRQESAHTAFTGVSENLVRIARTAITRNKDIMVHTLTHPETEKDRIIVDFASSNEEKLTLFYQSVFMPDLFALFGRAAEYARDDQVSSDLLRTYLREIDEVLMLLRPTLTKAVNPRLFEAR